MRGLLRLLALWLAVHRASTEINSSSDLNCDFSTNCLWRNGTNGVEDSGEFAPGTSLQMDDYHKVTALRTDRDDPFIYSSAFGGRQTALLVSDVVSCQLGGASLKYWYWKTGSDVKLDICVRQPPGSRDPANLKCYDGLASTHAQQWIYRSVEFPPISQPFELVFRATFTAPMDIIALDDIFYDAILCSERLAVEGGYDARKNIFMSSTSKNEAFQAPTSDEVELEREIGGSQVSAQRQQQQGHLRELQKLQAYSDELMWLGKLPTQLNELRKLRNESRKLRKLEPSSDELQGIGELYDASKKLEELQESIPKTENSSDQLCELQSHLLSSLYPFLQAAQAGLASHAKRTRRSPPTISVEGWKKLRESGNLGKQTLLVVSEDVQVVEPDNDITPVTMGPEMTTASSATTTEEVTSTSEAPETPKNWPDEELLTTSSESPVTSPPTTMSPEQNMANMVALLKGVAPVLPYVPTLVQTLQALDPRAQAQGVQAPQAFGEKLLDGVSPIIPINAPAPSLSLLPTPASTVDNSESLIKLAKQFGIFGEEPDVGLPAQPTFAPEIPVPRGLGTVAGSEFSDQLEALVSSNPGIGKLLGAKDTVAGSAFSQSFPGLLPTATRDTVAGVKNSQFPESLPTVTSDTVSGAQNRQFSGAFPTAPGPQNSQFSGSFPDTVGAKHTVPSPKSKPENNLFGFERIRPGTTTPLPNYSTIYPPKVNNMKQLEKQNQETAEVLQNAIDEEGVDLSVLSEAQLAQLAEIHRKIFAHKSATTEPTLVVYKKRSNGQGTAEMEKRFREIASKLPPDVLKDLKMLKDIPNLDELVQGLDTSLITKPGGFAKLKQQFIERLMRRTMGLPMMGPLASNSGGTEGAGGGFGGTTNGFDTVPEPPRVPDFGSSLFQADQGLRKSTLAAPSFSESIDPPAPPRSPFDESHFGYSRASAAKTAAIGPNDATPRLTGPRLGPAYDPRCPPVDCTFDLNMFCDYVNAVVDSDLLGVREGAKEWQLAREKVENTLTGISKDLSGRGSYIWAGGVDEPKDMFVLSSRAPLTLPAASRLDFFVHIAGVAGRLRVCFDSLQQCPFEVSHRQIGVHARQWNNFFVTVPEGSHTIHFVADGLRKNYVVGLDHIQLLSKYGQSAQPC
ncbi:unnamed protein product, partial [Mesorhabditis spiculigera]